MQSCIHTNTKKKFLLIIAISLMTLLISCLGVLFLIVLQKIGNFRQSNFWIIGLLPIGGFSIAWLYLKFSKEINKGNNLILEANRNPEIEVPTSMAPLIVSTTLLSHLVGASVGRESTAIQMSASISTLFKRLFNFQTETYSVLIRCAVAAGFSAVFGTPLTATVFALEWTKDKLQIKNISFTLFAAYLAYAISKIGNAPHLHFPKINLPNWDLKTIILLLVFGVVSGVIALFFNVLTQYFTCLWSQKISYPPLRAFIAGTIILLLVFVINDVSFLGLGVPSIENSFLRPAPYYYFILKIIFTLLSTTSGFKGGEVTPLFFIGACLGSYYGGVLHLDITFWTAIGFVCLFSGSTNTPLACTIMAIELFGIELLPASLVCCFLAYYTSGNTSVYASQIPFLNKYSCFQKCKSESRE